MKYIEKLRNSGLRPTKQRLQRGIEGQRVDRTSVSCEGLLVGVRSGVKGPHLARAILRSAEQRFRLGIDGQRVDSLAVSCEGLNLGVRSGVIGPHLD